jgi:hypothetical protein
VTHDVRRSAEGLYCEVLWAINNWHGRAFKQFEPVLTSFDLTCDLSSLQKTGIDVTAFKNRVSLGDVASKHFAQSKKYQAFVESNPSFKTKLQAMALFTSGELLAPESNTAFEDEKFYALPILHFIAKRKDWRTILVLYRLHSEALR